MSATVLPPEPAAPVTIHSCPACSHWLPDGTLACPDCHALTYSQHLSALAAEAQQLEAQRKWPEARDRWNSALRWLPTDTRQAESIRAHLCTIDARLSAEDDRKARWTKRLGPFAPVALFLLKAKSAFFFIFKLKFLFSILGYVGIYWLLFGWWFAVGFTASIFIHEMGHYVAIKRRGLSVELPVFLPGFGAYVRWFDMGVSREDLAGISLAGPLFGLFAAGVCWALYWKTNHALFLVLANLGAWLNVLNLVPVLGLDGAKAALGLTRVQRWLISAACVIFFALASARDPMDLGSPSNHYVFLILAVCMLWQSFKMSEPEEPSTFTMTYFLGVLLALGLVLHMTSMVILQHPELSGGFRTH